MGRPKGSTNKKLAPTSASTAGVLRKTNDLDRAVLLDVSADGAVLARPRKSKMPQGYLPFFSTDTQKEAEQLIVFHCRLARDSSGIYRINDFKVGVYEEIDRAATLFRAQYERVLARKGTAAARFDGEK